MRGAFLGGYDVERRSQRGVDKATPRSAGGRRRDPEPLWFRARVKNSVDVAIRDAPGGSTARPSMAKASERLVAEKSALFGSTPCQIKESGWPRDAQGLHKIADTI